LAEQNDLTKTAENVINHISFKQLLDKLNSKSANFLIDVRDPEEFKDSPGSSLSAQLEAARNIPLTELADGLANYNSDDALIFYCQTGQRSHQAASFAKSLGYREISNLLGGLASYPRENV